LPTGSDLAVRPMIAVPGKRYSFRHGLHPI
jgi:hypothetical protein